MFKAVIHHREHNILSDIEVLEKAEKVPKTTNALDVYKLPASLKALKSFLRRNGCLQCGSDEPTGCPRAAVTNQNIANIRDMSGFPLKSVVKLLINTTTLKTWEVRTGKFYDPVQSLLKSKNQEINRLQLAVKLPWAIFFESVDILS
ncbi:hypothetical protein TNCV_1996011 [Trichonephila clavipes]|uniref:Uncharacterized protein n=1 Tax=Trichonephila clavipes TaxID=2585209 RepID=A0A8X6V8D9_TRICX|nr:hypothetical protein TNCV_1996011 [Trichonephila clavipes]